jgi:histidine triad (HIT) family protein
VHGEGAIDCDFCDLDGFRAADVFIETPLTFFASSAVGRSRVLPGAGIICPRAHRESPFDLTPEEWADTQVILLQARSVLEKRHHPDGYNLIWNVLPDAGQEVAHVHLHLIPRFHDEPLAGRGARWHLKQTENLRADPQAPGKGRASSG